MNQAKLERFLDKLLTDISGAAMWATVLVGEELGLYRALRGAGFLSAEELAERAQCHPRLTREWLCAQAAAGYIETKNGRFRLTEEQAMALADEDSPAYVAPAAQFLASMFLDKDKLVQAMRGSGGLGWGDHHPCLFAGTERFFRPGYRAHLLAEWLPALDGVVTKLERGATVADVGCGHGVSTILMAQAHPASRFFGFDFHAPSIETAHARARESGLGDRVTFERYTAKDYPKRNYDLICFFDCLHDMGDPVGAARHAYEALADDGTVLLVEPFANDRLEDNLNAVGRMYYAASTFVCTPSSLAQEVGLALGAQAGEARLREALGEAGFRQVRRAAQTPFNMILEARK